jgi:hypothetical protein
MRSRVRNRGWNGGRRRRNAKSTFRVAVDLRAPRRFVLAAPICCATFSRKSLQEGVMPESGESTPTAAVDVERTDRAALADTIERRKAEIDLRDAIGEYLQRLATALGGATLG